MTLSFSLYNILTRLQTLKGKVSLSLDAWTLSNQYAFLAIVAHYMSNDGQLGACILFIVVKYHIHILQRNFL
jgi:hypothetical protein